MDYSMNDYPSLKVAFDGRSRGVSRGDYFSQRVRDALELSRETGKPVILRGCFYPSDLNHARKAHNLVPISKTARPIGEDFWVTFLVNY